MEDQRDDKDQALANHGRQDGEDNSYNTGRGQVDGARTLVLASRLRERIAAALIVLGLLVLIAAAYGYYWYSPAPLLPPLSATIRQASVRVGDTERTYLIYVPANLPPQAALVIVLHGSAMDGARMRVCTGYEFDRLADQHGFAVLYPDGYRGNWNDCRKNAIFPAKRKNIDDMSFIRTLIARVKVEQVIDQNRVYAFGYSNGGHMTFRLAMEAPDEVAAVTAVAASLPTQSTMEFTLLSMTVRTSSEPKK